MAISAISINTLPPAGVYFIALDRTNINDPDDPNYHVVCMPKSNKELVKPEHIFSFETQEVDLFSGSLENIHLVEILDHIDNGR